MLDAGKKSIFDQHETTSVSLLYIKLIIYLFSVMPLHRTDVHCLISVVVLPLLAEALLYHKGRFFGWERQVHAEITQNYSPNPCRVIKSGSLAGITGEGGDHTDCRVPAQSPQVPQHGRSLSGGHPPRGGPRYSRSLPAKTSDHCVAAL